MNNRVWLITGASRGLGLSMVLSLLSKGQTVVATTRNKQSLCDAIKQHQPDGTSDADSTSSRLLTLEVDLKSETSIKSAIDTALATYGRIDVIVNNAGYAVVGTVEEMTDAEFRAQFDINLFAVASVMRLAAPVLRAQRSGYVINVSSVSGFSGDVPGIGAYTCSKFALDGLTEAFAAEMRPFGVRVSTINPGHFRSSFLESNSLVFAKDIMPCYQQVHDNHTQYLAAFNNNQSGDPAKLVEVLIKMVESDVATTPIHVFIGKDSYDNAKNVLSRYHNELDQWEHIAANTDYEKKE
ncbi:hypothetical protein SAMD00019534_075140 [Acytostelium subglobosum LB1]|uniref:hypothetical protein n=1 Tax=Acytostelium subglobosum LB1 TaxID=1410327 RepID=UPI000644BEE5|nr:hypothetical protein SAMD00019534_075140 [Acytostelium subglobosum LB1]GAM24339.1 hypothetical protein SAMD00019534_075140 [Acytostelium subglobosum LB1]|eukprot:XP_012752665.1 hypothetical protein SAMD00019534_075140 [Acytostelium subglobosum LB1]